MGEPAWLEQVKPPDWLQERVEQDTRGTSVTVWWVCEWRGGLTRAIVVQDEDLPANARRSVRSLERHDDWYEVARELGLLR